MSWIFLFLAGCMEVLGVIAMKKFAISKKKMFLLVIMALFVFSFGFLSQAMREISMGTAYAIWTGIGACGGVIVGVLLFGEDKSVLKLVFIAIIIASSIGLKLVS